MHSINDNVACNFVICNLHEADRCNFSVHNYRIKQLIWIKANSQMLWSTGILNIQTENIIF